MTMMRSSFLVAFFLVLICGVVASSQAKTSSPPRIAIINTLAFSDGKSGILKLVEAEKVADNVGFVPRDPRLIELNDEIGRLERTVDLSKGENESVRMAIESKKAEAKVLQDAWFRRYKEIADRQDDVIVKPIRNEIGRLIAEFAKANGIDIIIDPSEKNAAILYFSSAVDVTAEFISFANAKIARSSSNQPK